MAVCRTEPGYGAERFHDVSLRTHSVPWSHTLVKQIHVFRRVSQHVLGGRLEHVLHDLKNTPTFNEEDFFSVQLSTNFKKTWIFKFPVMLERGRKYR